MISTSEIRISVVVPRATTSTTPCARCTPRSVSTPSRARPSSTEGPADERVLHDLTVGVVGATGQVGGVMRQLLERARLPGRARSASSPRRARPARTLPWRGARRRRRGRRDRRPRPASTSRCSRRAAPRSKALAPRFAAAGAIVIDNSSRLADGPRRPARRQRGQPATRCATARKGIIANPNCTTMAAMPVLKPLHDEAGLRPPRRQHLPGGLRQRARRRRGARRAGARRSSTGAAELAHDGVGGRRSRRRRSTSRPIAFNVIPLAGSLVDDGSGETDEEQKLRNESRKILEHPRPAGVRHLRARAGVHRPLAVDQRRVRRGRSPSSARDRAAGRARRASSCPTCRRRCRRPGDDPSYVGRIRQDRGRARRARARAVRQQRQPAQGRRAQRRADRRAPGRPAQRTRRHASLTDALRPSPTIAELFDFSVPPRPKVERFGVRRAPSSGRRTRCLARRNCLTFRCPDPEKSNGSGSGG